MTETLEYFGALGIQINEVYGERERERERESTRRPPGLPLSRSLTLLSLSTALTTGTCHTLQPYSLPWSCLISCVSCLVLLCLCCSALCVLRVLLRVLLLLLLRVLRVLRVLLRSYCSRDVGVHRRDDFLNRRVAQVGVLRVRYAGCRGNAHEPGDETVGRTRCAASSAQHQLRSALLCCAVSSALQPCSSLICCAVFSALALWRLTTCLVWLPPQRGTPSTQQRRSKARYATVAATS